jgi:chromosome partitioning protein
MKIIAIISQKGGAGKTTLAVHLATAAAAAGHMTLTHKGRPQVGAIAARQADAPEVISGQAVRLPALISAARDNGATFLALDTAPNADQSASLAARAADVILVPCRPAAFDLDAIGTTLMLTKAANKPAHVVLNAVPPLSNVGKEVTAGLNSQGANVAPHQLTHRAAFMHGVIDGRTAQEFEPEGKAAEEVQAIYTWLCGVVDMPTRGHAQKAA